MSSKMIVVLASVLVSTLATGEVNAACNLVKEGEFQHAEIGTIPLLRESQTGAIAFASQMHVNTDGAPDSYHPDDIGITHICNGVSVGASCTWKADCLSDFNKAKAEGFTGPTKICFFAMATKSGGVPIIQRESDPQPGFFVSTTALKQPNEAESTPQRQLDSNQIPFAVIPSSWNKSPSSRPKLGDFGVAYRRSTGATEFFVIGDLGPTRKLGEGSVALHKALGNDPFVKRFGKRRAMKGIGGRDVFYVMFPGSAVQNQKFDVSMIRARGEQVLASFGGKQRLEKCAKN
jgi:hypothetical protein